MSTLNQDYPKIIPILAFAQAVAATINSSPDNHQVEVKEQSGCVEFISEGLRAALYMNPDNYAYGNYPGQLETSLDYESESGVRMSTRIVIENWKVDDPEDVDYAAKAILEILYILA
jgi:hypothetical protein